MTDQPEIIRSVISYECPGCHAKLHICQGFTAPGLVWLITEDQLKANKAKVKELLKGATFKTKEDEEQTMEYIDSDRFALGDDEVELMARDILKAQEK